MEEGARDVEGECVPIARDGTNDEESGIYHGGELDGGKAVGAGAESWPIRRGVRGGGG